MKALLFTITLFALPLFAQKEIQCGKALYTIEGSLSNTSSYSTIMKQNMGPKPSVGDRGELLKYFQNKLFGGVVSGTLVIAEVKITAINGSSVTMKVLEQKSNIVINGKKKNHFVKGNKVKLNIYGYEKVQVVEKTWSSGKLKAKGKQVCGNKIGVWTYYDKKGIKEEEYSLNDDGKKDGEYIRYHENGAVLVKGLYDDGKKKGEWIGYYESGEKYSSTNYRYGRKEGKFFGYYKDGSIKVEGEIDYGERLKYRKMYWEDGSKKSEYSNSDRIRREWYEDGKIMLEGKYDYSGKKKDGLWKKYFENGNLKSEIEYKDGKYAGVYKRYYESGQIKRDRMYYWTGDKDGVWKNYAEDGTITNITSYRKNTKHGEYMDTYENGTIRIKGEYEDGKPYGAFLSNFENGKPKLKGQFDGSGKKHGEWISYFESGEIKSNVAYDDDEQEGFFTRYSAPGVLMEKGMIFQGKPLGEYESYYKNGKLKEKGSYDDDGSKIDLWENYSEDGKLSSKGKYVNGKKSGKWLEIGADGKKKKVKY